jgi:hypothetical protein
MSKATEAARVRTYPERIFRDAEISENDNPATLKRIQGR